MSSSPAPAPTPRLNLRHVPDYQWPATFGRWRALPRRALLNAMFSVSRAAGRIVELVKGSKSKSLLVIRTDGLGDAVLFEPAFRSLAVKYPEHRIHLWAPAPVCELYRAASFVSKLKPIMRGCKSGNLAFFRSPLVRAHIGYLLGRWSFDIAMYPAESAEPLGNFLIRSVRARERLIVDSDTENQFDWQKDLAVTGATRILSKRLKGGHELMRNAHLARQWGSNIDGERPLIHFADDAAQLAANRTRMWRSIAARVEASALIGIIPAGMNISKSYPAESWSRVLRELWHQHRIMPAFLTLPEEQASIQAIMSPIRDVPFVDMTTSVEVLALAAMMTRLDGIIAIDTGSAHLALAADVPSVILCGGGHPGRFLPWPIVPSKAVVLTHRTSCEGCHGRCTQRETECLTKIEPSRVVNACLETLGRNVRLRAAG